jgi:MscS family membrane protein
MNARRFLSCLWLAAFLCVPCAWAQEPTAPTAAPDLLGRSTPRGSLIGFITAARDGKYQVAAQYLNVASPRDKPEELAQELYIILNGRLNARILGVSDRPEGSLANPLTPDQDVIGVVATSQGQMDIVLERVTQRSGAKVWLFARKTLEWVPGVYKEVDVIAVDELLPDWLTFKILNVRLFDWLALVIVLPLLYRLLVVLDAAIAFLLVRTPLRTRLPAKAGRGWIPGSVRLLVLAVLIHIMVPNVDLPLSERRLWAFVASVLTVVGGIGLMLRLVDLGERSFQGRLQGAALVESRGLLRLLRRMAQGLVIAGGVVIALRYFGFDPTAALAGLGIGGIAIALAAQKTLENVIGGFSIVLDKAIRVGDFLKVGETSGTVDYIGLRSTRIRTLDRTIVTVPNGQMATVNIETLSQRDRFWFRHVVGLTYSTTPRQLREIRGALERLLLEHPAVDVPSARVRFVRLGAYSLDIELNAYVYAEDYDRFLTIQGDLLLAVMELVEAAGADFAFPSQTLHVANTRVPS